MLKTLRILAALGLTLLLLYAATLAVRDCGTGPYSSSNCLWLWVRQRVGLPQSRLWRAATLQLVGITLASGLVLTWRYVFPFSRRAAPEDHSIAGP